MLSVVKGCATRELAITLVRLYWAIERAPALMDSADDIVGLDGVRPMTRTAEIW
jgi:hypothetical protein